MLCCGSSFWSISKYVPFSTAAPSQLALLRFIRNPPYTACIAVTPNTDMQDQRGPIRFFSLNNNHLSSLRQLERLPTTLTHITALDLSNNPIASLGELSYLQARSEQKGKPNAGRGSMKNLTELKLVGCAFREEMLAKPNGAETYQQYVYLHDGAQSEVISCGVPTTWSRRAK